MKTVKVTYELNGNIYEDVIYLVNKISDIRNILPPHSVIISIK